MGYEKCSEEMELSPDNEFATELEMGAESEMELYPELFPEVTQELALAKEPSSQGYLRPAPSRAHMVFPRFGYLPRSGEAHGQSRGPVGIGGPPSRRNSMIFAFRIPEAPYSDEALERLHKFFEVIEGIHATVEIFKIPLAAILGVSTELLLAVGGPIAGLLGTFLALGAGYASARADIAKKRVKMGFAEGFVSGADGRKWSFVKSLFWKWAPEVNYFDAEAGRIGQKAFNLGLASGFVQGSALTAKQKEFFWGSIATTLTRGDRMYYAGPRDSWPKRLWVDWYIKVATNFIKLYVKD